MSLVEEAFARAQSARAASHQRQSSAARARNAARSPQVRRERHAECGTTTGYRYGCRCPECSEAKRVENQARSWKPSTARLEAIERDERGAAYRHDRYLEAVASAKGELARLIAEQAADERSLIVPSCSLDVERWSAGRGCEWEDPTYAAALESHLSRDP